MRRIKKSRYINYGSIPKNEYNTANLGESADIAAVLGYEPQPDDTAYTQRLIKRQAQHPAGRRKIRGWSRSWKANGWRAESASQQDESAYMRRYPSYVRKNDRSFLWLGEAYKLRMFLRMHGTRHSGHYRHGMYILPIGLEKAKKPRIGRGLE